jgi:hypothetical protein
MKNKLIILSAALILAAGCKSSQVVENIGGDGIYGKAAVPVSSWGSIGLVGFIGRFQQTVVIQPVSTNKVYGPNLAVVAAGKGKQTVSGASGTSTNGTAGVNGASWDASSLLTGAFTATSTNGTITIDQKP